jgi:hypothetical protein
MYKNIDFASLQEILPLASSDLRVQTEDQGNLGVPLSALREATRRGLRCRCVLPLVAFESETFAPGHYSLERLRDTAQVLGHSGWELRAGLPPESHASVIIVDTRSVIIIDRSQETAHIVVSDDPAHVISSLHDFDLSWERAREIWEWTPSTPWYEAAILYADTKLLTLPQIEPAIATISEDTWGRIIKELAERPDELFGLPPRKFEELVAELLHRDGFDVKLTQTTRDGGRDILAYLETMAGRHLFLVECKRWGRQQPVDVSVVRALYGVVMQERATAGLVVTTSHFTRDALQFRQPLQFQLNLRDYGDMVSWLKKHQRPAVA